MFRVVEMGHQIFATEILSVASDMDNIKGFLSEGETVVLVNDVEQAEDLYCKEITIVEPK